MKRLCIYLTYDKQNIVDRYIGYMLGELKTCIDYLVVVCNMPNIEQGREILEKYADEIFLRENIGYDAGGFKDAIYHFIGWNKLLQYDELILINDSFFGPFKPMKNIFDEMSQKNVDFWGLLKYKERIAKKTGKHIAEHIQSFFLAIRSRMLHSTYFRDFWDGVSECGDFQQTVDGYETVFTQYFHDKGFSYATLADTLTLGSDKNIDNNYNPYAFAAYELICKRNFPFLKRSPFTIKLLEEKTQEEFFLSMRYIEKNTDYPAELIWENIIRTIDISDLYRNLCLNYIVSEQDEAEKPICSCLIVVFIKYMMSEEYIYEYLMNLPDYCRIVMVSEDEDILTGYRKQGYECRRFYPALFQKLLVEFGKYDYVCILHDTDLSSENTPDYRGKSELYNIWGNLLGNTSYINGIIRLFEQENKLGLLSSPVPVFSDYFGELGKQWDKRINNFWIRGCVLRQLPDLQTEDLFRLPEFWCSFTKLCGFYSGIVESKEYASMNEINLQDYLDRICKQVKRQYGNFSTYSDFNKLIFQGALAIYCKKHKGLYVYGAGDMAREYQKAILEISDIVSYIVSDGQDKSEKIGNYKVIYLSEADFSDDSGVLLCVNEKNQNEIIPLLKKRGITDFMCLYVC